MGSEVQKPVEQAAEWEKFVSFGMIAREQEDKSRWVLGDLAVKVRQIWGREMVISYAKSIFVDKAKLLRYMDVSKAIVPELREEFKKLSWSHFRVAAGQKDPRKWLEKADDNEWTVELMAIEVKKAHGEAVPPLEKVKIVECVFCRKATLDGPKELICSNFHDCKKLVHD